MAEGTAAVLAGKSYEVMVFRTTADGTRLRLAWLARIASHRQAAVTTTNDSQPSTLLSTPNAVVGLFFGAEFWYNSGVFFTPK